jgi:hypothetical protein
MSTFVLGTLLYSDCLKIKYCHNFHSTLRKYHRANTEFSFGARIMIG